MKKPFQKLVIALIASVISVYLISGFVLIIGSLRNIADRQVERQKTTARQISEASQEWEGLIDSLYKHFEENLDAYVTVRTSFLKEFLTEEGYEGPVSFEDGKVVSFKDGVIEILDPEGSNPLLHEDYFKLATDETISGTIQTDDGFESMILSIREIGNDYYYVDWTSYDEVMDYLYTNSTSENLLTELEDIYKVYVFEVVSALSENSDDPTFRYFTYIPEEFIDLDLDISVFNKEEVDITHYLSINDVSYMVTYADESDGMSTVFVMTPYDDVSSMSLRWRNLFEVLSFIIIVAIVLWIAFVEKEAEDYVLNDKKKEAYRPSRVRAHVIISGIVAAIFLFATMSFVQVMYSLYDETRHGEQILEVLCSSLNNEDEVLDINTREEVDWYASYGEIISYFAENYPELVTREKLTEIAEELNVEYLIIFDENKEEIASSSRYVDYKIVDDRDSQNYEANKVFVGVPFVYYQVEKDELSGNKLNIYVTATEKKNGKYGAVLFAQDPDVLESITALARKNEKLSVMCEDEDLLMVAKAEDGEIVRSSDYIYLGQDIRKYGVDLTSESKMDYFTINRKIFYGLNEALDDVICYYFVSGQNVRGSSVRYSFRSAVCFLLCYALAARIMLKGYTDQYFNKIADKGIDPEGQISYEEDEKKKSRGRKKLSRVESFLAKLTPSEKTQFVFELLLSLVLIGVYFLYRSESSIIDDSLLSYIIAGEWNRGINLFAMTSAVLVLVATILVIFVLRFIMSVLSLTLTTRSETVLKLLQNLFEYILIIIDLNYICGFFGIDNRGLVASVGFLTLAVSLGSRDLVSDILAGLSIVFEGRYKVGDYVQISGFLGQVMEINIRSTKLIGTGDNVMTIGNSRISSVINMSQLYSWYPLTVRISADCDLEEVEMMLKEELPKIGKKTKEVISGPTYKGVEEIGNNTLSLIILTQCRQEHLRRVQRKINKELYELFKEKGIEMK